MYRSEKNAVLPAELLKFGAGIHRKRFVCWDLCWSSVSCLYNQHRPPIAPPLKGESTITGKNSPEPQGPLSRLPQPSFQQTLITVHILQESPKRFWWEKVLVVEVRRCKRLFVKSTPQCGAGSFLPAGVSSALPSDFFTEWFFFHVLFHRCHTAAELRLLLNWEEAEGSEENPLRVGITWFSC